MSEDKQDQNCMNQESEKIHDMVFAVRFERGKLSQANGFEEDCCRKEALFSSEI